jgi:hypothetical protein
MVFLITEKTNLNLLKTLMEFGKFLCKQCFVSLSIESNCTTGCVYLHKIVFETIIRSTNVFQKNKNKQFCISVDYNRSEKKTILTSSLTAASITLHFKTFYLVIIKLMLCKITVL